MSKQIADGRFNLLSAIIVMPAFNEAGVIAAVIDEIKKYCNLPIMVVDDASTDNTAAVAEASGAIVVKLCVQLGAWGATQTGIRYALRHKYRFVISMDADGQHQASCLQKIARPVKIGDADVCIGTCIRRGSILRQLAWKMMRKTSGLSLEDLTSGFRVYNQSAMLELAGWRATLLEYQDIGVLLMLQSQGLKILDTEVDMLQRINGPSRVFRSWSLVGYYMCHTLLLGLTKRRSNIKSKVSAPPR